MRASIVALLPSLLLVLPLAVGCGGKTSGGDGAPPTDGPVAPDQFLDAYVHAVCDSAGDCCRSNGFGHDAASCVSLAKAELGVLLSSTTLGRARYDADAAGRCIAAARTAATTCAPHGIDPRACEGVFTGDGAPGATCKTSLDCAPPPSGTAGHAACEFSSTTDGGGTTSTSRCVVVLDPKEGAACGGGGAGVDRPTTSLDCDGDDWFCDTSGRAGGGVCHARGTIGEACSAHSTRACVTGAICTGGKCVAGAPLGAACSGDECALGGRCDWAGSHTCIAQLAIGAACTTPSQCASGVCGKGTCVSSTLADAPICTTGG